MNAAKRAEVIQAFLKEHSDGVMKDKGGAYSRGEENCNSNFYRVGEALGHLPMQVSWVYALKHIDALSAYIKGGCKGKLIGAESVEGRIGDAVNYLLILYSILVQEGILDDPTDGETPAPKGSRENPYTVEDCPADDRSQRWLAANKPTPFFYLSPVHNFYRCAYKDQDPMDWALIERG